VILEERVCQNCGLLTRKWQRVNGGPWHCFDGCLSTTGVDRRQNESREKETEK
jgi:hypothetical protein